MTEFFVTKHFHSWFDSDEYDSDEYERTSKKKKKKKKFKKKKKHHFHGHRHHGKKKVRSEFFKVSQGITKYCYAVQNQEKVQKVFDAAAACIRKNQLSFEYFQNF